jgi:DinB superfamily
MSEKTPRYPIGKFHWPQSISPEDRTLYIEAIRLAPAKLREAANGISASQLDTPYREGGWTIRQVIHHIPESHMNAYIRFKLALTETDPVIKPYDEAAWARLSDVAAAPIEASIVLLESLHRRWVVLMRGLSDSDWKRRYIHPEYGEARTLDQTLALYAWHGDHHIAHVKSVVG